MLFLLAASCSVLEVHSPESLAGLYADAVVTTHLEFAVHGQLAASRKSIGEVGAAGAQSSQKSRAWLA